jgi:hypothetical protein
MIDFGALGKTTVHIGIGEGRYIEVPMLSVVDYAEVQRIQRDLAAVNARDGATDLERIDAIVEARGKLAGMAKKVMPVETHDGLMRMDYMEISALVVVLCNGKDDSEHDDPQKKTVLPSQLPVASLRK